MHAVELNKVAAADARSIIVLNEAEGEAEKADAAVLRIILTLINVVSDKYEGHIVAELQDVVTITCELLFANH